MTIKWLTNGRPTTYQTDILTCISRQIVSFPLLLKQYVYHTENGSIHHTKGIHSRQKEYVVILWIDPTWRGGLDRPILRYVRLESWLSWFKMWKFEDTNEISLGLEFVPEDGILPFNPPSKASFSTVIDQIYPIHSFNESNFPQWDDLYS